MERLYFDGRNFFGVNGLFEKVCPLLPIGTFQPVNFVPFTSFLFFHQFQALLDLTIGIIQYF
jgi:hypothetical protein